MGELHPENLKPFKKGDKRINRLGRPKSFDALRKLAQRILAEAIETGDGEAVTRIEAMLKLMSSSRNPQDRKTLLEYAYGKVKEEIDLTSKGEKLTAVIGVTPVDYRAGLADLAPRPVPNSDPSGENQDAGDGSKVG